MNPVEPPDKAGLYMAPDIRVKIHGTHNYNIKNKKYKKYMKYMKKEDPCLCRFGQVRVLFSNGQTGYGMKTRNQDSIIRIRESGS